MTESAIYQGKVFHRRYTPTRHAFDYDIYLFWLKLSELETLNDSVSQFSTHKSWRARFRREDYLGDPDESLQKSVLSCVKTLKGEAVSGDVFFLGQLRMLGLYFSPVNFYFIRNDFGAYTDMLAEVSNTPWNERHYYHVDLLTQADTKKQFHVSPFNPMDMTYQWRISSPEKSFRLTMDCVRKNKEFTAGLDLQRQSLNSENLRRVIKKVPSMTIKTVIGIYWQALRLWMKRTPVYSYPIDSQE